MARSNLLLKANETTGILLTTEQFFIQHYTFSAKRLSDAFRSASDLKNSVNTMLGHVLWTPSRRTSVLMVLVES